jgi:hypothetical protein
LRARAIDRASDLRPLREACVILRVNWAKKILLPAVGAALLLQFFRTERNAGQAFGPDEITTRYAAPAEVKQLLSVACYDCHSNATRYPWYANVQPVAWWLGKHVQEGKTELNFSAFGTYSKKKAIRKLEACSDEVGRGEMPLPSYKWIHRDARLTDAQAKLLSDWFESVRDKVDDEER